MNKNNIIFDSENLIVDWVGFNIQRLVDQKQVSSFQGVF